MYHSIQITIKDVELCKYFDELTSNYNNMLNVTNFHIRQIMTGLTKDEKDRTPNEIEVIENVKNAIEAMNKPKTKRDGSPKITKHKGEKKIYTMPTDEKWFKGYDFWNEYFNCTDNVDYYSLPGHVNQDAIKDTIESWSGYFELLREFKKNPSAFSGKPNIPHYHKSGAKATVTLSNQVCKIKIENGRYHLRFPKTKCTLDLGNAEFTKYVLKETKVKPMDGYYVLTLVMDDLKAEPEHKENKRIIGIDIGVDNLAAISNNVGLKPMIVKGNVIKAYNQWCNKRVAQLQSCIDKNIDNIHYGYTAKEQVHLIYDYRYRLFSDLFHKVSKFIVDYCVVNEIDTIVIGKNRGWKQDCNMGHQTNQSFCMIPHQMLIRDIQYKAAYVGINVVINEESYTSKASFLDNDDIPTYKPNNETKYTFSGCRIKRGLYKSKDGTLLNADVNGASNIIRKAFPSAFNDTTDFSYLYTTTESMNFHDFAVLPAYKYSA